MLSLLTKHRDPHTRGQGHGEASLTAKTVFVYLCVFVLRCAHHHNTLFPFTLYNKTNGNCPRVVLAAVVSYVYVWHICFTFVFSPHVPSLPQREGALSSTHTKKKKAGASRPIACSIVITGTIEAQQRVAPVLASRGISSCLCLRRALHQPKTRQYTKTNVVSSGLSCAFYRCCFTAIVSALLLSHFCVASLSLYYCYEYCPAGATITDGFVRYTRFPLFPALLLLFVVVVFIRLTRRMCAFR